MLFAALYFSEGAPIGYVWWALPVKLKSIGLGVEQITAITAPLILPWAFKFLWAPLVDTFRGKHFGLRGWIITAQLLMGLALLPLAFLPFEPNLTLITQLLMLHAILAATQDVAVDALCISTVPESERGKINGLMQVGYIGARAIFGGAILIVEQWMGESAVIIALVVAIWSSTLLTLFAQESPTARDGNTIEKLKSFGRSFVAMCRRRATLLGLGFALVGGAAFESVGAVAGPLLKENGHESGEVGLFYLCFALPGALLGGFVADRVGRRLGVLSLLILIAINAVVIGLALRIPIDAGRAHIVVGTLGVLYILIGAFTAASYAMFMDLTDPRLGGTQFSTYMGATNLCEAWSAWSVGKLIGGYGRMPGLGYTWAFAIMAGMSLLAIPLIAALRFGAGGNQKDAEESHSTRG